MSSTWPKFPPSLPLGLLTLVAARAEVQDTGIQFEAAGTTHFTVQPAEEAAHEVGLQLAYRTYPAVDGWVAHTVHVHELPPTVTTEGYQITWQLREDTA